MTQQLLQQFERDITRHPGLNEEHTLRAIGYVGDFYSHTGNLRVARAIARIVEDCSLPEIVRTMAYVTLFQVIVNKADQMPVLSGFEFPSDVDWRLVRRYSSFFGNVIIFMERIVPSWIQHFIVSESSSDHPVNQ